MKRVIPKIVTFVCVLFFILVMCLVIKEAFINTGGYSFSNTNSHKEIQTETTQPERSHIIDVDFISQSGRYPTGCEAVTAVMAMDHSGINISVDDFIDYDLPMGTAPYEIDGVLYGDSPWECFLGSPYDAGGWGCYAPVIEKAIDQEIDSNDYEVVNITGRTLDNLCAVYIQNDIPVIIWATMEMKEAFPTSTWTTPNGESITWVAPEHCLLLVGYDEAYYYFNDPRRGKQVSYPKKDVEAAYTALYSQAVVIVPIE